MRLDKLYIEDFKNLKEFSIDFDENYTTTVFIGHNGTGKSNLIEAIVIIFRDLDLSRPPSFSYGLTYFCRGHKINVRAHPDNRPHTSINVDGKKISFTEFTKRSNRSYLPKYIFAYYSGTSQRLDHHFDAHRNKFYNDLLRGVDEPFRPLFLAQPIHSQFVLLAFFSSTDEASRELLEEYIGIIGMERVIFNLKQPDWKSNVGDSRFWNARGVVAKFLSNLYEVSTSPVKRRERDRFGFRRSRTREHMYLLIENEEKLISLARACGDSIQFFKMLESTFINELLYEVEVRVKKKDSKKALSFRELSEGEQQLLVVFGLMKFTKDEESLFLLDEPDTQLNPAWKLDYLNMVGRYVGENETSHVLVCTHDPLLIGGLFKSQVRIFRRDVDTGKIVIETPEQDPRGMGVAALLTSELFGLPTTLDLSTESKLKRKRGLFTKSLETKLTDEEKQEMEQLSNELETLGFTRTTRDPLYDKFVRATMSVEEFQKPVLTPAEKKRQDEIAIQLIKEILEEERQSGT